MGRCGFGVGAWIAGFSLSLLLSDTSVLLLPLCLAINRLVRSFCTTLAKAGKEHFGSSYHEVAPLASRHNHIGIVRLDVAYCSALVADQMTVMMVGLEFNPPTP